MGADGQDGADGLPGENSGFFLGWGNAIHGANHLRVQLNGGRGSSGQDGGNGAEGANGPDGQIASIYQLDPRLLEKIRPVPGHWLDLLNTKYEEIYRSSGKRGERGGRGGRGGSPGKGGFKGDAQLYQKS